MPDPNGFDCPACGDKVTNVVQHDCGLSLTYEMRDVCVCTRCGASWVTFWVIGRVEKYVPGNSPAEHRKKK